MCADRATQALGMQLGSEGRASRCITAVHPSPLRYMYLHKAMTPGLFCAGSQSDPKYDYRAPWWEHWRVCCPSDVASAPLSPAPFSTERLPDIEEHPPTAGRQELMVRCRNILVNGVLTDTHAHLPAHPCPHTPSFPLFALYLIPLFMKRGSDTPLSKMVRSPQVVRDIDWLDQCWPDDRKQEGQFPKVRYAFPEQ